MRRDPPLSPTLISGRLSPSLLSLAPLTKAFPLL